MGLLSGLSSFLGTSNNYRATAPKDFFQASGVPLDETAYADAIAKARDAALAGTNGGNVGAQQTSLAQALQRQMAGNGPSLAQRQLETGTQQIQSQAAGQLAGVNGINPALAARLIAQRTADVGQQAAGQAATTRLQEQLGTEGLLSSALAAQRGQDIGQQTANTSLAGTLGGLQQGQNQVRVGQNLGVQGINANVAEGNANRELGAQQINAGVSAQNANTNAGMLGGLMQGGGAALALLADGGEVPAPDAFTAALLAARQPPQRLAEGGAIYIPQVSIPDYSHTLNEGGQSLSQGLGALGKGIGGLGGGGGAAPLVDTPLAANVPSGSPYGVEGSPLASSVPTDTGMPWAPPNFGAFAEDGSIDFRSGGHVPGQARVPGDDPENDTVDAKVSPGEIVLPRSVAQAPDAARRAAEFVAALKAKKGPSVGYGRVLATQRALAARMADGGQVPPQQPDPSLWEAIRRWAAAKGDQAAPAGRDVDEAMNAKLPEALSARRAVLQQRERQRQADAAARDQ